MKALLSTIVDNVNFGTYLQSYATVRLLEKRGWEVDVLNYIRPHLNHKLSIKKAFRKGLKHGVMRIGYECLDAYMKSKVKAFLASNARLTPTFTDWASFRQTLPRYDLYLTGSDQVWNSTHNHGVDEVFYFGGIKGRKRSYAASVGIDSFPENERERIKSLLDEYDVLSVRESFGVDALKKIGIEGAVQVLDPTLMVTGDEWRDIDPKKYQKKEPYLLVYSVEVNRDKETLDVARKIAKERGLKVYVVSPYVKFKSKLNVDKVFSLASTETFLALFAQADYAVVSSFHGTAFAVNFNCQFITVSPERFSSRVMSLLKLLHLENRYISGVNEIPSSDIDYEPVNKILSAEREKSNAVLDRILEAAE